VKSIEQIIQDAYAANSYLTALVPSAKFITGTAKNLELPYITLNREGSAPSVRSNSKRIDRVVMRMQFWGTHTLGTTVRDMLVGAFDNWGDESSNPRIVMMRKANDLAIEEDDGVWQFLIDFVVETQAR
jgi:hypothetical protein